MSNLRQKQERLRPRTAPPAGLQEQAWLPALAGTYLPPVLIAVVGLLAYYNSFGGAFIFDNQVQILENPAIRTLRPFANFTTFLHPRSLVTLSLALNYNLGGFNPWGYHLVNLVIHILAALTLYGLVRRTLLCEPLRARYEEKASWLALAAALLWLVHPLQTESVTYVIQRAEALMGLFYLLTLYFVLRGAEAGKGTWWYGAAMACCTLGMASKEVMVTAPLLVLLYNRTFLAPSFVAALRQRWLLYTGLGAMWGLLASTAALILSFAPSPSASAGFGVQGITPLEYAGSQPGIIVYYLRLGFWPEGLCLDYGWPVAGGRRP